MIDSRRVPSLATQAILACVGGGVIAASMGVVLILLSTEPEFLPFFLLVAAVFGFAAGTVIGTICFALAKGMAALSRRLEVTRGPARWLYALGAVLGTTPLWVFVIAVPPGLQLGSGVLLIVISLMAAGIAALAFDRYETWSHAALSGETESKKNP